MPLAVQGPFQWVLTGQLQEGTTLQNREGWGLWRCVCRGRECPSFQGLIRWYAKCIKFCRHFNSNMLDSWVSPEAAGFFISFTEGQNPLLPPPPTPCSLLLDRSPALSRTISLAACSLLVGTRKPSLVPAGDRTFRPSCQGVGGLRGWELGFSFFFPLPHLHPIWETYSPPLIFIEKKAGKASIWRMNN